MGDAELRDWANDLYDFREDFMGRAKKVLSKAGVEIKKNTGIIYRAKAHHRRGGHTKYLPQTTSYDVTSGPTHLGLEVGFDLTRGRSAPKGSPWRAAALSHFAELGLPDQAPMPALYPAGDAELPVIQGYLDLIVEDLLG